VKVKKNVVEEKVVVVCNIIKKKKGVILASLEYQLMKFL